MIQPRIGAGLDREESIFALLIGHAAPGSDKMWIQRGAVLIHLVLVTTSGVALPDFDQRVGYRPLAFVQHPPDDNHPLSHRLPVGAGVAGQISVRRLHRLSAEPRGGDLRYT